MLDEGLKNIKSNKDHSTCVTEVLSGGAARDTGRLLLHDGFHRYQSVSAQLTFAAALIR